MSFNTVKDVSIVWQIILEHITCSTNIQSGRSPNKIKNPKSNWETFSLRIYDEDGIKFWLITDVLLIDFKIYKFVTGISFSIILCDMKSQIYIV